MPAVNVNRSRHRSALRAAVSAAAVAVFLWLACGSAHATVWLCRPGVKPDPCQPGLSTTVYNPALTHALRVTHPKAQRTPPVDCFYVYPTVSDEKTGNSNLQVQDTERSIATYQVGRYSQYCRVYAPMYRQVTLVGAGLSGGTPTTKANSTLPVSDVEHAFADYLAHDNHGRGFVLIGHSQGALVLEKVIAQMVDPKPAVRRRLLSAILMGGNVLVKGNTGIGGDFKHIPACRRDSELGCVIAFSTFDQPVPSDSLFGRPNGLTGLGVAAAPKGDEVLCTNPADLAGGDGRLDPITPSAPFAPGSTIALGLSVLGVTFPSPPTAFWSAPGAYTARCADSHGAHVLEVTARDGAPTPQPAPTPAWGLHLLDANLSQGNLVSIVAAESRAFLAHPGS